MVRSKTGYGMRKVHTIRFALNQTKKPKYITNLKTITMEIKILRQGFRADNADSVGAYVDLHANLTP